MGFYVLGMWLEQSLESVRFYWTQLSIIISIMYIICCPMKRIYSWKVWRPIVALTSRLTIGMSWFFVLITMIMRWLVLNLWLRLGGGIFIQFWGHIVSLLYLLTTSLIILYYRYLNLILFHVSSDTNMLSLGFTNRLSLWWWCFMLRYGEGIKLDSLFWHILMSEEGWCNCTLFLHWITMANAITFIAPNELLNCL